MMNNMQINASLLGVVAVAAIVQPAYAQLSGQQIADIAERITVWLVGQGEPGSAVLIKRDGDVYTILTAYHVVKDTTPREEAYVTTFDKQRHPLDSRSIRRLGNFDLAIATFRSDNNYQVAKIGDSNRLRTGMDIYVSGFPKATETIPEGEFAFLRGLVVSRISAPQKEGYQLVYDNKTLTGISGGAVINDKGELVGIHGKAEGDVVINGVQKTSGRNLGIPSALFVGLLDNLANLPNITPTPTATRTPILPKPNLSTSAEDYFARALKKQNQSDFKGAIADYNESIRLSNSSFIYIDYTNRGNAKKSLGDNQGAISDYNQAILINPKYTSAYNNRAHARFNLGDYQGAIADCNQAIQITPKDSEAYNNRGNVKYALGDKQGAITDYNQAIRLKPNYDYAYSNRGLAKSNLGDYQGAITDFNQAIQITPNFADAYFNRGFAYKILGEKAESIESFREAARLYQQQGKTSNYQDAENQIRKLGE